MDYCQGNNHRQQAGAQLRMQEYRKCWRTDKMKYLTLSLYRRVDLNTCQYRSIPQELSMPLWCGQTCGMHVEHREIALAKKTTPIITHVFSSLYLLWIYTLIGVFHFRSVM